MSLGGANIVKLYKKNMRKSSSLLPYKFEKKLMHDYYVYEGFYLYCETH